MYRVEKEEEDEKLKQEVQKNGGREGDGGRDQEHHGKLECSPYKALSLNSAIIIRITNIHAHSNKHIFKLFNCPRTSKHPAIL